MISINKVNDYKVKTLSNPKYDPKKIKGYDLVPGLYYNIFLCARKESGKTTVLWNILDQCSNKNTKVYFFVNTLYADNSYEQILNNLNSKGIEYEAYMSIYDEVEDERGRFNKINVLDYIVKKLNDEKKHAKDEEDLKKLDELLPKSKIKLLKMDEDEIVVEKKKPKTNKLAPELIFIFDDVSEELTNTKSFRSLLKKNRHYKSKVVISSQDPTDLYPDARSMIDLWIIFKHHNEKKLETIHKSSGSNLPFDLFTKLYKNCTEGNYNFLWFDKNKNKYRQNFDLEIKINI